MIANYLQPEKEVLVQVANHMILSKKSYNEFYDLKMILNRRLVNLVASTKLYYDQMKRQVRTRDVTENTLNEYKEINDQEVIGLYAYGESDETSLTKIEFEFAVLREQDDVRINLLAKNKKLINLSKPYVTGQSL